MRFRHGLEFVGISKLTADEIWIVAVGIEKTTTFPLVISIEIPAARRGASPPGPYRR